jgi:DNA-binding transcriptional ArsR family regulator
VTEAGGAGAWSEGTSWGGSLKLKRRDRETVTVSKVRLIDEPIPRFDFVKLDLQGGERDAILGMGDRLSEAKLLCVEIQLAWGPDNPVELLLEHGFICFYDRLQFGFRPGTMSVPLDVLEECGLVIDRMRLPQGSMPLVCWGYFEREGAIDPTTYVIRVELAERLRESGMDYIQTDTLAINARHWSSFAQLISA